MPWAPDKWWFVVAVLIYGVSTLYTIFLWRRGFRRDNRVTYLLLACAFVFHTTAMIKRGLSLNRCPIDNLYEATAFFMWTLVGAYLVFGLWHRVRFLGAFASPFLFAAGVFALFPGLDVHGEEPTYVNGLITLHAALILLGYGAFALSAVAGVMYLTQERNLKYNKLLAIQSLLPPIQRLSQVGGAVLLIGLALMTAGLAMAPIIAHDAAPITVYTDAKFVWSVIVWSAYAVLAVFRWRRTLSGRRLALGSIGVFVFVMLTYWGTNMWSKLH